MDEESISEATEMASVTDPEMRQLLGLFDVPAYARRGQDLENRISSVRAHCRRQRSLMLEPAQMRTRQWARLATGPDDGLDCFAQSPGPLWTQWLGDQDPLRWARVAASTWWRKGVARDLVASLDRFNHKWIHFLSHVDLTHLNQAIDLYNRYYVFEKECALGSARLAARHFQPLEPWTNENLRGEFPAIVVPQLRR